MLVFAMFTSALLGIVQVGRWVGGCLDKWVDGEWVGR